MTNLSDNLAMTSSGIADVTSEFFENCGGNPGSQLSCLNVETEELEFIPLEKPCVLMGRAKDCDVKLDHREISFRHVYLQMIHQRLLVVDLGSRGGTEWDGTRRRSGWLMPGREIQVGCFKIRLVKWNTSADKDVSQPDSDVDMQSLLDADSKSFPKASLELLSARSQSRTGRVLALKPGVTLIGRSRVAQLRLKHESVSHVHSSLVLTQEGLWVVDLLGRDGTRVNGEPVKFARLQLDDHLQVGAFHLRVDTDLVKSPMGVLNPELHDKMPSTGDSVLLSEEPELSSGDSSVVRKVNEENAEREDANSDEQRDADEKEATVMEEAEDTTRWAEIIDALKAGGFGS